MSGIGGIISLKEKSNEVVASIQKMEQKLKEHGADDAGFLIGNANQIDVYTANDSSGAYKTISQTKGSVNELENQPVDFAYCHRLSSLHKDLKLDLQPAHNREKTVWVVLDGEVYNREDLYQFVSLPTHNDAELIAELYTVKGKEFVTLLNGDFSFSLYDATLKKHFLARDRGGAKALFYTNTGGHFIFGSSIRSILVSGIYKTEVDWDGLWNNIGFPVTPQPLTCFKGVKAVERGHIIEITNDEVLDEPYWKTPIENMLKSPNMTENEAGEMIDEAFQKSMKRRCKSDFEIGSLISGGVDSPYISAVASQHVPDLKVFTFGLADPQFQYMNEVERASLTAEKYNLNHVIELFSIENMIPHIDKMVDIYEQPGASFATNYFLAQMVKEAGVKVVLNGLAADEQHGGFHYFKFIKLWRMMQKIPFATSLIPRGKSKKWEDLKNLSLAKTIDEYYSHAFSDFKEFEKKQLMPNLNFDSYQTIRDCYSQGGLKLENDVQGLLYYMFANVQNHHLYRFDQFTKHFGLEARYPFLDNDCIDVAFKIPAHLKVSGGNRKIALKNAASRWIAKDSLAKKKVGLVMPMGYIVNNVLKDFVQEKLNALKTRDQFSATYIDHVYRTYREIIPGKIWKLVMVELWFEKFIDHEYK
ncbi:MAG: asparagine synthase (glutamine-hydrolyzing) [Flavobacteriales bacterium]|nr:asparagine synthase (glutamine-hydrolyzing) [Flavobacteriales bacterium]